MTFLPYSTSGRYKGKTINGCVVYKDTDRTPIPAQSLDITFQSQISHFLNILDNPTEPKKVPSFIECQYCDITREDCSDRIETDIDGKETTDLPM
jgi:hypothetical protein